MNYWLKCLIPWSVYSALWFKSKLQFHSDTNDKINFICRHSSGLEFNILKFYINWRIVNMKNTLIKRPMGHIAHLRNQFKSTHMIISFHWYIHEISIPLWKLFFIWPNLNPLHPRMLCAKFNWNEPSNSREDFLNIVNIFCYFVVISPWKRACPFIWTN